MPAGEFDLIARHLTALGAPRSDVILGVGDDAAIVDTSTHGELRCACICVTLSNRSHRQLAQAIAAGFQDLVSRLRNDGFSPVWATLVLTLARPDETLVRAVAGAVHSACLADEIAVIGGDTSVGSASLTVFLHGSRNAREP